MAATALPLALENKLASFAGSHLSCRWWKRLRTPSRLQSEWCSRCWC